MGFAIWTHVLLGLPLPALGGLEVDDQIELRRLLDREVGRLGALQNLVDVRRTLKWLKVKRRGARVGAEGQVVSRQSSYWT